MVMKRALLSKELREGWWKFALGTGFLILTAALIPLMYNWIIDFLSGAGTEEMSSFIPDTTFLDDQLLYLWSQWNGKNLYQFGSLLAIILGMSPVASEVKGDTIGFLLARPLSRATILVVKALAGIMLLVISVFLSTLVLIAISRVVFAGVEIIPLLVATLNTLLGLLVIYSLALLFSVLLDEQIMAGLLTVLVLIIAYLPGWLNPALPSLVTFIDGSDYILDGSFSYYRLLSMGFLFIALHALGLYFFKNKDY